MAEHRICPDCPAAPTGVLGELVQPPHGSCALHCVALGARQPMPQSWFTMYGLALVRRGIIVRQRVDAHGCATAIDALGPGGAAPMSESADSLAAGYAADDAMICLCPKGSLRTAVDAGAPTAGEVMGLHVVALDRVERMAEARALGTALGRVAAGLRTLADTLSPPRRMDLVPSALQQRDLAALLAMRHESICRAIGQLERRGAIVRSEDGIRILDRALLDTTG